MKNKVKHNKTVLVVSAHPDDETIGCGGAILNHVAQGDSVFWLNVTGVSDHHPHGFTKEFIKGRSQLILRVAEEYGFTRSYNLQLPTMMLDTIPLYDLVKKIDRVVSEIEPNTIYLPNRSDVHSDHRVVFQAAYACTKNFRKPYIREIFMYETLSETEFAPAVPESAFIPNYYLDISKYMSLKLDLVKLYETEVMPEPLPRSLGAIKALCAYRGSRIGAGFAEAFNLILKIDSDACG